ncbi:hypothetical protein EUTSA_v10015862mg [Eutrema salsugineum]|uniref:Uncharacterized protein n=1 Tax=Eutrema salsugineum TaxID=72664 RepID=V4KT31_EUTSA|nr:hypothetical protein EUTSA_v10015862mg [Eutrema salsugineum]
MGNGLKPFKEQPLSFAYEPLISPPISLETEDENLRVFSFEELKKATKKFRQGKVVIGEDRSVRTFYKGYIDDQELKPELLFLSWNVFKIAQRLYKRGR